jgi:phosphatidate cytidylyltransferase
MLKQRVITAIILVALVGTGIIKLPTLWLAGMFIFLVLIASWEWANMAGFESLPGKSIYTFLCGLLMLVAAWVCQLLSDQIQIEWVRDILGLACIWWAIALLWVKSYPASAALWGSKWIRALMGFVTLVPVWLSLVYLRSLDHGIVLIFILLALVACADIGAYFTGRAWGKAKLASAVSPGKSWAGFWGGLACSSSFTLLIWWQWGRDQYELPIVLFVAIMTSLASVLGDLVESMIKRHRGIKDSGSILPGHGGMMDRLDGITAAAPVFALCLLLAG